MAAIPFRAVLLVLVAAAALTACQPKTPAPEPERAVRLFKVGDSGTPPGQIFAAEIRARTETVLSFRVPGRLESRLVDNGQAVKAGQVLARLDPADLQLAQQAADAGALAAKTNLDQLEADLLRYRELRAQGFVGPAELERREAAAKAARAQWDQARASAQAQGRQAGYTTLVAPAAGVVTGVLAEPGQVLAAGTPLLRLAQDGPRDVVFSVPEGRIDTLRTLKGRADALLMQLWGQTEDIPVTLRELAAAADPVTRTFQAKADLGRANPPLGQTAQVRLVSAGAARGWRLPLGAIFAHEAGSAVWVFDRAASVIRLRPVQLAGADGNWALVVGGLKEGEEVVSAGTHLLAAGQKVKPWLPPGTSAAASGSR
ncbi:efflux RND transporter periplasmic adaptor subunit [Ideonella sp. 4Y11]|uniref:Efflux RND transporter periplasmic adaptor subunit n=1 Tax=Ideonella aquatica TaxID=2824119 RepID=A0A940YHW0_9BURK|nr:efflux RND transporter periplasmic adaptor subunit [Ideonella aquatica]MBQ0959724.1 efflux RND transporter periplasmic adaptor subunit [Ideonella aquatica]